MKRFKKGISVLCIIAMLVVSIVGVFAEDGPSEAELEAQRIAAEQAAAEEAARIAAEQAAAEEAARIAAEEEAARIAAEQAAAEEAARIAAEEEAARIAAEEEAARRAAEEEAARKAAEEEAARKAAEEEAARKAAEEEAARKAAEEEAARKAAEEEAARKAAEEEAARKAEEEASYYNGVENDWSEGGEPEYEEFLDGDCGFVTQETLERNVSAVTPELIQASELDDEPVETVDASEKENTDAKENTETAVEPEAAVENPEATEEPEAVEPVAATEAVLQVGGRVSGTIAANVPFIVRLNTEAEEIVVLTLTLNAGDAVSAVVNGATANFTEIADEDPTDAKITYTYYLNAAAGIYEIVLNADTDTSFSLKAETEQTKVENSAEIAENTEEIKPAEGTEEEISEETSNNNSDISTNNNDISTEGDTTEGQPAETIEEPVQEEPKEPLHGWVTVDGEAIVPGDAVLLKANADGDLSEYYIVWQSRAADEETWHKIGYSQTMILELTEENIHNLYRFKIEDGNFSDEYQFAVPEAAEEDTEDEEGKTDGENDGEVKPEGENDGETKPEGELTEEAKPEESTAEPETAEEEKTEEVDPNAEKIAQGYALVTVNEEGADLFASTEEGAEANGHLEAGSEIWVKAVDETWATLYVEPVETAEGEEAVAPAAQYIRLSDVNAGASEEAAEETEETAEETEAAQIPEGYDLAIVSEGGADVFESTEEGAEAVDHLEAGTQILVKAIDETWATLYNEDTEAAAKYIALASLTAKAAEEAPETVEEEPEAKAELPEGYYIAIVNEEGADVFESLEEGAEAVEHLEAGTEVIVKNVDDTWAALYNEDTEAAAKYIALANVTVKTAEEAPETVEEEPEAKAELPEGYYKAIVNEEGADIFESLEEGAEPVDHLEAGAEVIVRNVDETWATLYNEPVEAATEEAEPAEIIVPAVKYIALAGITAAATEETEATTAEEFVLPEGASVSFEIKWDGTPAYGATVHFVATVSGLDDYNYTLQWQKSVDDTVWENIEGETGEVMDMIATVEANELYYRVVAVVQGPRTEETPQNENAEASETEAGTEIEEPIQEDNPEPVSAEPDPQE